MTGDVFHDPFARPEPPAEEVILKIVGCFGMIVGLCLLAIVIACTIAIVNWLIL